MELAEIPRLVHQLTGRTSPQSGAGPASAADSEPLYPRVLGSLSAQQIFALGEDYLSRTRIYLGSNAPAAGRPGATAGSGGPPQPGAAAPGAVVRPNFNDKLPNQSLIHN